MKTLAKTKMLARTKAKTQKRMKTKCSFGDGARIMSCKERGEWAELCFMARAAGEGLRVLKPYGDSRAYDVAVERGGPILRVQVKSTIYKRRKEEYSLNVMGPGRKAYPKGAVDYFAIYLIPVDAWYIVPQAAMGKSCTIHFTVQSKRHKYAKYREAWDLLRGRKPGVVDRIFGCEELPAEEMLAESGVSL
jgi:hypothetical protein